MTGRGWESAGRVCSVRGSETSVPALTQPAGSFSRGFGDHGGQKENVQRR